MSLVSASFALFAGSLLAVYYAVPGRGQWIVLLFGSLAFYLCSAPACFPLLLLTAFSAYAAARLISGAPARKKGILAACLILNFALLGLCKLLLVLPGAPISALPPGISFYTFQTMGYVIDVSRGTVPAEKNFFRFLLCAAFFPTLSQGPICRYARLAPQLAAPHPLRPEALSAGLERMLWGYFKKLVIADRIAPAVAALRQGGSTAPLMLVLSFFYAVQIWGDFTGGIDIVLGLSQALGIELPENFRQPFLSKNTAEFWRRWHITLGEWTKDYIFYPLSVSAPMRRFSKFARCKFGPAGKRLPVYAATIVTWCATGIWHGLTPNFLLWGMLNCAVIILSQELAPLYAAFHRKVPVKGRPVYNAFQVLRTFTLMNLIRLCDLFPRPADYFRRLFSLSGSSLSIPALGLASADWAVLAVSLVLAAVLPGIPRQKDRTPLPRWTLRFALLLMILIFGCYGQGYDAASFIYNQF